MPVGLRSAADRRSLVAAVATSPRRWHGLTARLRSEAAVPGGRFLIGAHRFGGTLRRPGSTARARAADCRARSPASGAAGDRAVRRCLAEAGRLAPVPYLGGQVSVPASWFVETSGGSVCGGGVRARLTWYRGKPGGGAARLLTKGRHCPEPALRRRRPGQGGAGHDTTFAGHRGRIGRSDLGRKCGAGVAGGCGDDHAGQGHRGRLSGRGGPAGRLVGQGDRGARPGGPE